MTGTRNVTYIMASSNIRSNKAESLMSWPNVIRLSMITVQMALFLGLVTFSLSSLVAGLAVGLSLGIGGLATLAGFKIRDSLRKGLSPQPAVGDKMDISTNKKNSSYQVLNQTMEARQASPSAEATPGKPEHFLHKFFAFFTNTKPRNVSLAHLVSYQPTSAAPIVIARSVSDEAIQKDRAGLLRR